MSQTRDGGKPIVKSTTDRPPVGPKGPFSSSPGTSNHGNCGTQQKG